MPLMSGRPRSITTQSNRVCRHLHSKASAAPCRPPCSVTSPFADQVDQRWPAAPHRPSTISRFLIGRLIRSIVWVSAASRFSLVTGLLEKRDSAPRRRLRSRSSSAEMMWIGMCRVCGDRASSGPATTQPSLSGRCRSSVMAEGCRWPRQRDPLGHRPARDHHLEVSCPARSSHQHAERNRGSSSTISSTMSPGLILVARSSVHPVIGSARSTACSRGSQQVVVAGAVSERVRRGHIPAESGGGRGLQRGFPSGLVSARRDGQGEGAALTVAELSKPAERPAQEAPPVSRLIERPRPVPPYLRAVPASACWKASKMSACLSGGYANAGIAASRRKASRLGARSSVPWPRSQPAVAGVICQACTDALLGELEGIGEQVFEDLLQAPHVGAATRWAGSCAPTLTPATRSCGYRPHAGTTVPRSRPSLAQATSRSGSSCTAPDSILARDRAPH